MTRINPEEAANVYVAGQHMSNWLYNMSQHSDFAHLACQMREMVEKWDAAKSSLADAAKSKKRRSATALEKRQ